MSERLEAAMREAARLTRAGRLAEAAAVIQRALAGDAGADPKAAPEVRRRSEGAATHRDGGLGARLTGGTFGCAAGERDYRLFVPGRWGKGDAPLLVMLHGCGQDPDSFDEVTRMSAVAEEWGIAVLYPAQSLRVNGSGCWSWYSPESQRRDAGEPAILAGMTSQVCATLNASPRRVFVAGFSAGGAMAATMAATYPDRFAGVGVHSGLPYSAAQDMVSAMSVMAQGAGGWGRPPQVAPVPVIVFQGDADRTVHPSNALGVIDQFLGDRSSVGEQAGGHLLVSQETLTSAGGMSCTRDRYRGASGGLEAELWILKGAGHGWSGGNAASLFSEPAGPDASREMVRFFLSLG